MQITSGATQSQRSPNYEIAGGSRKEGGGQAFLTHPPSIEVAVVRPRGSRTRRLAVYLTTQLSTVMPVPHVVVHADVVAKPIGLG